MRRQRTALVVVALALLLLAVPAAADWNERVQKAARLLQDGQPEKSLRITRRLTVEMVEGLGSGEDSRRALATVLALRAAAEAATGREDDARFHWSFATSYSYRRDLEHVSLEPYGEGGRILEQWRTGAAERERQAEGPQQAQETAPVAAAEGEGLEEIEPPRRLETVPPQYTRVARQQNFQGVVILQATIDRTGKVGEIQILRSAQPGLDYRAAESLRATPFAPALRNGEPVDVYYNSTINFSIDHPSRPGIP
ncbi:MAG TPA: energy transducer TonB [Thermoanaerobaculia bacterium]|nr:energy transducer TonB [Thermoanaerobaculia bacterium]